MYLSLSYNHLQLLLRSASSEHDADGYSHSGVVALERDNHSPSSSVPPVSFKGGNFLESQRVSSSNHCKILTCILESVENELHLSSKVSLAEHIRSLIGNEVKKIFDSPEDNLSKVT